MKEEFVTYEQALALKELGFNDYCYRGYDKNQMLFYSEQESGHLLNYSVGMNVSAPFKQQVFRWFRENFNLHSVIENDYDNYYYVIQGINNFNFGTIDSSEEGEVYKTYEEAEDKCINKLITII